MNNSSEETSEVEVEAAPPSAIAPYAIVQVQGSQYKVAAGNRIVINRLTLPEDSNEAEISLKDVVYLSEGQQIGTPFLRSHHVVAKLVKNFRGPKIRIFKKKRRKNHQKTRGHRQELTELEVLRIESLA